MNTNTFHKGAVLKAKDFKWEEVKGYKIAKPISAGKESENITGIVVEIPVGEFWESCEIGFNHEVVVVVYKGKGTATVDNIHSDVTESSALYSPTGTNYSVRADKGEEIRLYIWQSKLPADATVSQQPRLFNNLFNNETVLKGFKGNDPSQVNERPANMNFLFWPGTGCAHLSLHCGIQEPGENFGIHQHPNAEELFIGMEGKGQVHLDGEWIDFEAGDILYSREKIFHGTRNPYTGLDAKRFVTCGGPVPFDPIFYISANLSPEVK